MAYIVIRGGTWANIVPVIHGDIIMGLDSNTWRHMGLHSNTWAYIVIHGDRLGYIVIHGKTWAYT